MNKCDMCKGLGYLIVDYSCLKHSQMIQAKKHKCNVKEIEKCESLCANCRHIIHHYGDVV